MWTTTFMALRPSKNVIVMLFFLLLCKTTKALRMKHESQYMFLSGTIDRTASDRIDFYYIDDEWLNVTCSLEYPRDISYYYDSRHMWWEFEDGRGIDRSVELPERKKQKINATSNSITVNLKLFKKYDKWSLSCRHADFINNVMSANARQGTIKITLHSKEESLSSKRTTLTETPEESAQTGPTKNENDTPTMRQDIIIWTSSTLLITLTVIVIIILLCYVCKSNNGPKQKNDGTITYANLDFSHEPGRQTVSRESSSPYAEIVFPDEIDEIGCATVLDKRTKDKSMVESLYAEVSPYAEVSFKNDLSQKTSDVYAKVLPKSQRNKKIENNSSKENDNYATVVPKSERNKPPANDHRDNVSKDARHRLFGDDLYAEISTKSKTENVAYANISKECNTYANAQQKDANKYANINIELICERETVTYGNLRDKMKVESDCVSQTVDKQITVHCTENVDRNIVYDEVRSDDRKKLIYR